MRWVTQGHMAGLTMLVDKRYSISTVTKIEDMVAQNKIVKGLTMTQL